MKERDSYVTTTVENLEMYCIFYFGTFELWQRSLSIALIISFGRRAWWNVLRVASAGPVLFRNTVDFRPGRCSVDFRQIP